MIIRMDQPLANDHPDQPALVNDHLDWTSLSQMIIWMDQPLANDHPMDRPLANDHPDGPASCK